MPALVRAAPKATLRVLAWPGYADADVVKAFEQSHKAKVEVEVTYIASDEDLWRKLSLTQGADFDTFAINTAELQRYINRGWVAPIALKAIPNTRLLLPRFAQLGAIPGLKKAEQIYALPYAYAEMGLLYDRQQMPQILQGQQGPDSIAALWDSRWRGKVIAYDGGTHNFSLAAQRLGLHSPFQLAEGNWPAAVDALIALRRNVGGFYTQLEESVALFKARKAALMFANFGRQQLKMLRAAGVDAGYALPKEGALAWLDCWAVTKAARNPGLAHAWINHVLDTEPGRLLATRQGLGSTTSGAPDYRADDRLVWLQPVESDERRNLLWRRIAAGDRASRVLAA
jgi:putative spermidine/putrescine transport system substrate-binding protein